MKPPNKCALEIAGVILVLAVLFFLTPSSKHPKHPKNRLPTGHGTPAVAVGDNHGVILASDGSLWTWGETGFGWQVLGLGSSIRTQACLQRIGSETNWAKIAVGGSTTLGLKSDGSIWAWGENIYGQLGDGTKTSEQASPVHSAPGNDWKDIAVAGPHSVALKQNGSLWAWGNNWAGQLGNGTTNHSRLPVQVGTSTNWTRVWANLIQNVAQQRDGSLWFWGWDYSRSQKGSSIPVPTRVSPDTNWVSVGMGDWMVLAIKSDGTLWAWGRLAHNFTGATNANLDSFPLRVGTNNDWRACASFAQSRPVFMKRDGSVWVMDGSEQRDRRGVAPVTAIVASLVTNNQLNFIADGSTLQCDPAFGVVKSLEIAFQLGGINQTQTFAENSTVILGGTGEQITILRALYGDPRLFANPAKALAAGTNYETVQLYQIRLPKDVVAFCGGRHMHGTGLTASGEVWTWGEALGRHTPAFPPLQLCSRLLNRVGVQVHWGDPGPLILKEPARLGTTDSE